MKKTNSRIASLIFWLGILLPFYTLCFEGLTHACATDHFDPMPTWLHAGVIFLVPTALWVAWQALKKTDNRWFRWASFLHGAALVVIVYYMLALGGLSLLACMMLPFSLLGGLPILALVLATLGPLAGFFGWCVAAVRLFRWRCEHIVVSEHVLRRPWCTGLVVGVLAIGAAELPMVLVYEDFHQAVYHVPGAKDDAVMLERLRTPGREAFLLRLCYSGGQAGNFGPLASLFDRGPLDDLVWAAGLGDMHANSLDTDRLRDLYFRVTGQAFSDLPPPRKGGPQQRGRRMVNDSTLDGFAWDEERGGRRVGARLRGLSLATSRMDWHLDKDSALAYGEWTLEFRNTHSNAQEARCQMLLPPRGCVSRLTLWINGEPREAAFGSKQQVTQAYQQTVVVERRDPVLVNMVGPDRVMTQCFPVPARGTMKIRLGITAPVDARVQQRLVPPLIIERNFNIPADFHHTVLVQSNGGFGTSAKEKPTEKQSTWSWQSEAAQEDLLSLRFTPTDPGAGQVWSEDPFATAEESRVLIRETAPSPASTPSKKRVIAVVDGSVQLQPHAQVIRDSLQSLAAAHHVSVLLSTDGEPLPLESSQIGAQLNEKSFRGGRDSVPALTEALKQARKSKEPVVILWLHGPQPWEFQRASPLAPFMERESDPPAIHAVSLVHGRNQLLEQLYNQTALRAESRWDGTAANLPQILQLACSETPSPFVYRRSNEASATSVKVWDQLVRQLVFEEVLAAFKGQDHVPDEQAKLAARHQLVTPYSGAVVLETQQQYDSAGLKPVDAGSAPQIPNGATPEPHRMLLLLLGFVGLAMRRRR